MRVRRCAVIFFEPRERIEFELERLLDGGDGLHAETQWFALAPHLDAELALSIDELAALARIEATPWTEHEEAVARIGEPLLALLLGRGLLIGDGDAHAAVRARDDALRASNWRPLNAAAHMHSRWRGVAAGDEARQGGFGSMRELAAQLGAPPPHVHERALPDQRIALPTPARTALDELLAQRVTCRNFDVGRTLSLAALAQVLQRTLGAQGVVEIQPDNVVIKRNSPSGGGLHPVGGYVIAQHVDELEPGLYHYHPVAHALEPVAALEGKRARELALLAVAGQEWFADAHALVVLAARFPRTYWKYRSHAKAYRVVTLDAGHLSQMLYIAATELGLGAFVTAAINEVDLERALALDPLLEGPIAVCGIGWRAAERTAQEFDPGHRIWSIDRD